MPSVLGKLIRENLTTVVELERELYCQFSPMQRLTHRLTLAFGSLWMGLLNIGFAIGWITLNSRVFGLKPIDPWPFQGLMLGLAVEAVVLSFLVLISQSIMQKMENHRAHMSLQIELLAEQEATKILEVLGRIERALGLSERADERMAALTETTHPGDLSSAIREQTEDAPKRSD